MALSTFSLPFLLNLNMGFMSSMERTCDEADPADWIMVGVVAWPSWCDSGTLLVVDGDGGVICVSGVGV